MDEVSGQSLQIQDESIDVDCSLSEGFIRQLEINKNKKDYYMYRIVRSVVDDMKEAYPGIFFKKKWPKSLQGKILLTQNSAYYHIDYEIDLKRLLKQTKTHFIRNRCFTLISEEDYIFLRLTVEKPFKRFFSFNMDQIFDELYADKKTTTADKQFEKDRASKLV